MTWDPSNTRCSQCDVETIRDGERERDEAVVRGAALEVHAAPGRFLPAGGELWAMVCRRCGRVDLEIRGRKL